MRRRRAALWLGTAAVLMAGPALARQVPAAAVQPFADPYGDEVDSITVTASRSLPGSVIGDIPPEMQLSPRDIRAYGVSSVSDLIDALTPQTSTGRGGAAGGRPVILVNGARISSFGEVRDIPTEAIARVEILPEEVALKYGYRADQKVVNLVLRRRFQATTVEGGVKGSTQSGGGDSKDAHVTQFAVLRDTRLLLDAKLSDQSKLLETERDIAQPRSDAAWRTLVPSQSAWGVNGVYTKPIKDGVAATLNGSLDSTSGTTWLGLNTLAGGPLRRQSDGLSAHLGGGMAGAVKGWRWTATANADRNSSESTTDRVISGLTYRDTSRSVSTSADSQVDVNGTLFRLPAGAVSTTLTGGLETTTQDSRSLRSGVASANSLSRDTARAKLNLDIPLTSKRNDVLAALGDLSVNLNLAADRLSDFDTLTTVGAGANWGPNDKLRLITSITLDHGAPSLQQIGNPDQLTPGVQAYDFKTGQSVVIARLDGGNADLQAQQGRVIKMGLNLKPFSKQDLTLSSDYISARTDDLISSFPTATNQIESAFPDRFTRNATGTLIQIDARPVNFDHRTTQELRTGFTFRKSFSPPAAASGRGAEALAGQGARQDGARQGQAAPVDSPPENRPTSPGAPPTAEAPPAGASPGGVGGGGFGGGGFGGGRGGGGFGGGGRGGFGGPPGGTTLQVALYHTVKFSDEIVTRPGLAPLDLLNGAALGAGGGTAKNQFDLQANLTRNGLGASLNGVWKQGSIVRGTGSAGAQDLTFSSLATIRLRLFADLGLQPALRDKPFFRGARLAVSIDNLFDARQTVRAPDGATPIPYQEDYLDPRGRVLRISFRKVFFPPRPAVPPRPATAG